MANAVIQLIDQLMKYTKAIRKALEQKIAHPKLVLEVTYGELQTRLIQAVRDLTSSRDAIKALRLQIQDKKSAGEDIAELESELVVHMINSSSNEKQISHLEAELRKFKRK